MAERWPPWVLWMSNWQEGREPLAPPSGEVHPQAKAHCDCQRPQEQRVLAGDRKRKNPASWLDWSLAMACNSIFTTPSSSSFYAGWGCDPSNHQDPAECQQSPENGENKCGRWFGVPLPWWKEWPDHDRLQRCILCLPTWPEQPRRLLAGDCEQQGSWRRRRMV